MSTLESVQARTPVRSGHEGRMPAIGHGLPVAAPGPASELIIGRAPRWHDALWYGTGSPACRSQAPLRPRAASYVQTGSALRAPAADRPPLLARGLAQRPADRTVSENPGVNFPTASLVSHAKLPWPAPRRRGGIRRDRYRRAMAGGARRHPLPRATLCAW